MFSGFDTDINGVLAFIMTASKESPKSGNLIFFSHSYFSIVPSHIYGKFSCIYLEFRGKLCPIKSFGALTIIKYSEFFQGIEIDLTIRSNRPLASIFFGMTSVERGHPLNLLQWLDKVWPSIDFQ